MTLDERLEKAGLIPIDDRMRCDSPMDGFMRHAGVNTFDDFLEWVENQRRQVITMIAHHDLGDKMSDDIADFVYGKSAILWEVHANLLHVMKGMKDGTQ